MPEARPQRDEQKITTELVIESPGKLQEQLAQAVEQILTTLAPDDRRGILITRRSETSFTVETSSGVPHGTILEQDSWQRPVVTTSRAHTEV